MSILSVEALPIYAINLKRDTVKREALLDRAAKLDLDVNIFDAVDGKIVTAEERRRATTKAWNQFAHPAVLGCAMSHVKLWRFIVDNNLDYCLILEDDVQLVDNFKCRLQSVFDELCGAAQTFDILFVGSRYFQPGKRLSFGWKIFKTFINLGQLKSKQLTNSVWIPELTFGLHAYILSRDGAINLLRAIEHKISFHIDYQIQRVPDIKSLVVWEPLALQSPTSGASSISAGMFPHFINELIDVPIEHEFSPSYILNCPIARICGQNINYWTLITLIFSAVFCYFETDIRLIICLFMLFVLFNFYFLQDSHRQIYFKESQKTLFWVLCFLIVPTFIRKYASARI